MLANLAFEAGDKGVSGYTDEDVQAMDTPSDTSAPGSPHVRMPDLCAGSRECGVAAGWALVSTGGWGI